MSQADELLNSSMETYTANMDDEPHIVIGEDRFITVPDELKRIAVQFDHRAETVVFDCPRYWDNQDMSQMRIYINYERTDGLVGMYLAQNVKSDELDPNIMHFEWTITRNVAGINGSIEFNVCCKKVDRDGNEQIHWNSELNTEMYVSQGMENWETVKDQNPDIVSQLLDRMDENEEITEVYMTAAQTSMEAAKVSETNAASSEATTKEYMETAEASSTKALEVMSRAEDLLDTTEELLEKGKLVGPPGIQGPKGDTGEQGLQGVQGVKGEKGDKGDTGESGVIAPVSGFFTLSVDADGNLWASSADGETAPTFEFDEATGDLYFVTED